MLKYTITVATTPDCAQPPHPLPQGIGSTGCHKVGANFYFEDIDADATRKILQKGFRAFRNENVGLKFPCRAFACGDTDHGPGSGGTVYKTCGNFGDGYSVGLVHARASIQRNQSPFQLTIFLFSKDG